MHHGARTPPKRKPFLRRVSKKWLPDKLPGRIFSTILQVVVPRSKVASKVLVLQPWQDDSEGLGEKHPVLSMLTRVKLWQGELASGSVRSLRALAKREELTPARISQLLILSRLSERAADLLHSMLNHFRGPKEAFSLRKVISVALLPERNQLAAIEYLGRWRKRGTG